jgi:hypothetical protein
VSHSINLKPRPSRKPGLFFEALMSKTESPGAACWPGAPGGHSQDSHAESAACRDYLERAKTVLTRLPLAMIQKWPRQAGESLAISIPRTDAVVVRHFQARMPYGLIKPDVSDSVS